MREQGSFGSKQDLYVGNAAVFITAEWFVIFNVRNVPIAPIISVCWLYQNHSDFIHVLFIFRDLHLLVDGPGCGAAEIMAATGSRCCGSAGASVVCVGGKVRGGIQHPPGTYSSVVWPSPRAGSCHSSSRSSRPDTCPFRLARLGSWWVDLFFHFANHLLSWRSLIFRFLLLVLKMLGPQNCTFLLSFLTLQNNKFPNTTVKRSPILVGTSVM